MYAVWKKSDLMDYRKAQRERRVLYSKTDEVLYDMEKAWVSSIKKLVLP